MGSTKNQISGVVSQSLLWSLQHLFFPALIVFLGIWINNYYQAKKQPNLVAYASDHHVMKISDDEFKIKCPFTILNSGGSSTENKRVALIIPRSVTINEINISEEYKGFYTKEEGGIGYIYVVYLINLPKGKAIDGNLVFYCSVNIPEKSMCPLTIIY